MSPKLDDDAQRGPDELAALHLVDWPQFWAQETEEEWLAEPLLPKGRGVALVAGGKAGKSLLLLDVAVAVATGRPILGKTNPNGRLRVLYLDYEMAVDDLRERLEDMGYGPEDDLSSFHYSMLPSIDPLDTEAGGRYVLQAALRLQVDLVAIDTLARAVEGAENDADTYRAFYMHTSMLLKQHGITMVRADHTGHENQGRARGSSAKGDDVDVVWSAKQIDGGLELTCTHQRIPWVPKTVTISRKQDPLRHVVIGEVGWPAGTSDLAKRLDQLGAALDIGRRPAVRMLKAADGKAASARLVGKALHFRRLEADRFADRFGTGSEWFPNGQNHPDDGPAEPPREPRSSGNSKSGSDQREQPSGTTAGTTGNHPGADAGTGGGSHMGTTGPDGGSGPFGECGLCHRQRPAVELDEHDGMCGPCGRGRAKAPSAERSGAARG